MEIRAPKALEISIRKRFPADALQHHEFDLMKIIRFLISPSITTAGIFAGTVAITPAASRTCATEEPATPTPGCVFGGRGFAVAFRRLGMIAVLASPEGQAAQHPNQATRNQADKGCEDGSAGDGKSQCVNQAAQDGGVFYLRTGTKGPVRRADHPPRPDRSRCSRS